MTHRFTHLSPDDIEGATPERLATLVLVDQCLTETSIPFDQLLQMEDVVLRAMLTVHRRINTLADQVHADDRFSHFTIEELRDMSEPALRAMIAGHDPMDWREVAKRNYVAPLGIRPVRSGAKHRAQIWANGTVVYLGQFDSIEERDAAVEAAKARKAMGLPVKL